ncbi:MAG: hypothetical protein PVG41_22370 [Desulfobacteraceae bacterium]
MTHGFQPVKKQLGRRANVNGTMPPIVKASKGLTMNQPNDDKLSVHVNVQITASALQSIVSNAKRVATRDANGSYRIDTADQVSIMITRFLDEKDFEAYAKDIDNYKPLQ